MRSAWPWLFLLASLLPGCDFPDRIVYPFDVSPPARTCTRSLRLRPGLTQHHEELLAKAAADLAAFSSGRIRIRFDDFGADYVVAVKSTSDLIATAERERRLPPGARILGMTSTFGVRGLVVLVRVALVVDLLTEANEWRVVAHELGHACGLADIPSPGSVMSESETKDEPRSTWFSAEDWAECRSKGLCP